MSEDVKVVDPNERFSETEILKMLRECDDLNPEFKNQILTMVDGMVQAVYNSVKARHRMTVGDTYGDCWCEQYNRVVELYQRFH